MSYLLSLINPLSAGYLYGFALAITKKDKKNVSPILSAFNEIAVGFVYACGANLASKALSPYVGEKTVPIVLYGVAGYIMYKYLKKTIKTRTLLYFVNKYS